MKWIRDNTSRFAQRPYYEQEELDNICEAVIQNFLQLRYGKVCYPIDTDDLTILIEQDTSDLDLYADLSSYGDDIEGVTEFLPDKKPQVLIAKELSEQDWRENRLRTSLTHEYGHVKLHSALWAHGQLSLFSNNNKNPICKREQILGANKVDWLEWQAGYASGAFLMPITPLKTLTQEIYRKTNPLTVALVSSSVGRKLIQEVMSQFQVSEEAAKVRLLKLGYVTENQSGIPLWSF
jgi:Zn-dependent peptidase ImmA (M78 family)